MITITRRQARRLRGVFRHTLGIGHRGPVPPLVLRADGVQLRAQHRYAALAVEYAEPGDSRPHEALALPLEALADVAGRDNSPVALEAAAPGRTVARWEDRGIPRACEYLVPTIGSLAPFPTPPAELVPADAGLLAALAEAAATAADATARYALDCILLRAAGEAHEVVATDGRQLLVHGGFRLPWAGDVLVRRSPVFACKELPRDRPLALGRTDTYVVLRAGPWTLSLEIQAAARFPRIDRVIPEPGGAATRLRLDPEDAAWLLPALDRFPGGDEADAPATVDLNGRVAIRARATGQAGATELVLARSAYSGEPVRVHANRAFLARAVRLGFAELEVSAPGAPVVCRDGRRTYAFQPLGVEAAIAPADDAIRIESTPAPRGPARPPGVLPKQESSMSERTTQVGRGAVRPGPGAAAGPVGANDPTDDGGSPGPAALIREAEALHAALAEAKARARRLVAALRKQRKRERQRLMASTLAALKQLRLQDVAAE
jgi:hypothetical protein